MFEIARTQNKLNPNPYWCQPISEDFILHPNCMLYFDQDGYDLTPLEQEYAKANNTTANFIRWRRAIMQEWYVGANYEGVHINHAHLYERKGYEGEALKQISQLAKVYPIIYKLIHMKPKWGIDISIDYVDETKAFEVFHYEWDDFDYNTVLAKQHQIEELISTNDWEDVAEALWCRRDEWIYLDPEGQSKFKTDFLGVEPDRFKLVAWSSK